MKIVRILAYTLALVVSLFVIVMKFTLASDHPVGRPGHNYPQDTNAVAPAQDELGNTGYARSGMDYLLLDIHSLGL